MTKTKEKAGYSPTHVDPEWNWIEGLRENSNGREIWFPLYCFQARDTVRTEEVMRRIRWMVGEGGKVQDDLDTFKDFRIRWAGEESDALPTLSEVRNPIGGFGLVRLQAALERRCGVPNPKTGAICMRAPGHYPATKHSSDPE
jgi:hypothetical protein